MMEEWHGIEKCHKWQVSVLRKKKPDAVGLEAVCSDQANWELCQKLSKGRIDVQSFIKKTGLKEWSDPTGYLPLLNFLKGSGIAIFPLDQTKKERDSLREFLKNAHSNASGGKDIGKLFNAYDALLKLERERAFRRNIMKAVSLYDPSRMAILVGPGHHDAIKSFFSRVGKLKISPLKTPNAPAMRRELEKLHVKAKPQTIVELVCTLNSLVRT